MNSVCIIIPYFGKLPNYFQLWLESCKNNDSFTWLVFTDDDREFDYPNNVKCYKRTLKELETMINNKMNLNVKLDRSYKLCDFKPTYGFLFNEYINNFTHWGYCDLDMIFGDLSKFITKEYLGEYDKISVLGHLSILKNKPEINECFFKADYKSIFEDKRSRIFDEVRYNDNINNLLIQNNFDILQTIDCYDVDMEHYNFYQYVYISGNKCQLNTFVPTIFEFDNGRIFQIYNNKNTFSKKEIAYVHLQKRKMDICTIDYTHYYIVPNKFISDIVLNYKNFKSFTNGNLWYLVKQRYFRIKRAIISRVQR